MVQRYTLDTNCIIDLEENRPDAESLRKMIADHGSGAISLAVVAISASENQRGGTPAWSYTTFEEKLKTAGLGHLEQILPMAYWDVAYWDHSIWDGDPVLERKIHDILFPGEPIEQPEAVSFPVKKWLNHKCDVQLMWAHIYHDRDIFVTRDDNFHSKANALLDIGLRGIIRPGEYAS